eukprot:3431188-Amphidinium_carterae.2
MMLNTPLLFLWSIAALLPLIATQAAEHCFVPGSRPFETYVQSRLSHTRLNQSVIYTTGSGCHHNEG